MGGAPPERSPRRQRITTFNLFVAFAFTVMADPVSSVAYALESALGGLDGDLSHLVATMVLVLVVIAVVAATYHQLIGRFPNGGGGAEGLAAAFGDGWAFLPVGALLVDFTLTIAVSCAAGAAAVIAYLPAMADLRVPLAITLALVVAAGMLVGHRGRVVFATATLAFVAVAIGVIARGAAAPRGTGSPPFVGDTALVPLLLAMPLGMALATGVEAPSNAIAQLGALDDARRRTFGRVTLWLMLVIVGGLTLALALLGVRLNVGEPAADSTFLADIAERSTGGDGMFAAFQLTSLALLLAAAASSYMAGSGLLRALARHGGDGGLVPSSLGRVNRFFAPSVGIAALAVASCVLIVAAGGRDQRIVQYYAVAVFASFLGATVAAAVLAFRDGKWLACGVDVVGGLLITMVLLLNVRRVSPLLSLAAAAVISMVLYRTWVRRGRPAGVAAIGRESLDAP